jgi:hypothetical protein
MVYDTINKGTLGIMKIFLSICLLLAAITSFAKEVSEIVKTKVPVTEVITPFVDGKDGSKKQPDTIRNQQRIMCLGDSITVGYTDNPTWNVPFKFGYRSKLYTLLKNAGYNFTFVGDSPQPWNKMSGDPSHGGTYRPKLIYAISGRTIIREVEEHQSPP